jgi:DNA repair protein RadA/Sms
MKVRAVADPSAQAILDALACSRPGCTCQRSATRGSGNTHCPSHEDRSASFTVHEQNGRVLFNCKAGCPQDAVLERLSALDLWPSSNGHKQTETPHIGPVKRYPYVNGRGDVVAYHCRKDGQGGKHVWFERSDGVASKNDISPRALPLYRLPDVLRAPTDEPVTVHEGEKCADAAHALGYVATSLAGGASQVDFGAALAALIGRDVYLFPDNDTTGQALMQRVGQALTGIARSVSVVTLPDLPNKGDVADWIEAGGDGADLLNREYVAEFMPNLTSNPIESLIGGSLVEASGDELAAAGHEAGPLPYLPLLGQDGYFIEGWSHLLAGYPRCGKTELMTEIVCEWLAAGRTVVYLTEEPKLIWDLRMAARQPTTNLQPLPSLVGGGTFSGLHVVFGLGADPTVLQARAFGGTEEIVIVDTIRSLIGFEDESNNAEIGRVLNPWIAKNRETGKTLILMHHGRKGGGDHGEGIAGGHALLGVCDIALELMRLPKQERHRRIIPNGRLISPSELVYEKTEAGAMVALGDPRALAIAAVKDRVLTVLDGEWRKTREVHAALGDPQPVEEQVRKALLELAYGGSVERDPPVSEEAKGKTHRWRVAPNVSAPDIFGSTDTPDGRHWTRAHACPECGPLAHDFIQPTGGTLEESVCASCGRS